MATLIEYLEQYALFSLEKKYKLSQLIRDRMHELDLDAGTIGFSGGLVMPYQVLGTESDHTLTWLWAWADEQTEIPEDLLRSARVLRDWGAREGIEEFTAPSIDLDRADGNAIAMVSAQITRASSYFRDSYEGGAAYLLFFDASIDAMPGFDRATLVRELSDLLAGRDLDHRNVLKSYFLAKGIAISESATVLSGELETGERLVAEFDEAGRLRMVNGAAFEV